MKAVFTPSLNSPIVMSTRVRTALKTAARVASAVCCGIFVALGALASVAHADVPPRRAPLTAETAWVRALPANATTTAAFFVLKNDTDRALRVVAAASTAAKSAELHNHVNENGVMKMKQLPFVEVGAHASTTFAPGGLHVMLIDLVKPLKIGDTVSLTLRLEDNGVLEVTAPVLDAPPSGGATTEHAEGHGAHHHDAHAEEGHGAHAHGAPGSAADRFHAVLSPLWHAAEGPDRLKNACARAPELAQLASAVVKDGPPAKAAPGFAAAAQKLEKATGVFAKACNDSGDRAGTFTSMHDAFHALMEQLGH